MAKRRRPTQSGNRQAGVRRVPMVDAPSRHVQAARSLWNDGRRADALRLYSEAILQ